MVGMVKAEHSPEQASARTRMVVAAAQLLARQGYQATSFSAVLDESGAPRGSIYHHFPEGKDQLVGAALDAAGGYARAQMAQWSGRSASEVLDAFLELWRTILVRSDYRAGCSLVAVTVSTLPEATGLVDQAGALFDAWRSDLAGLLEQGGVADDLAPGLATTIIAAAEGAVILCRAQGTTQPLNDVGGQLHLLVSASAREGAPTQEG